METLDINEHLDDYSWLSPVYGLENADSAVQKVGTVETRQGRLLNFPNVLQHSTVFSVCVAGPNKAGTPGDSGSVSR